MTHLRVKFVSYGQEFHHTFSGGSSYLIRNYAVLQELLGKLRPIGEELCKELLEVEILGHRQENCYTAWLFEHLELVPTDWIHTLALNLSTMDYNWV